MAFYDRIPQRAKPQKLSPGEVILPAFGVFVAAVCIGLLVFAARYQLRYRRFVNEFAAAVQTSNKLSLRLTWQGEELPVTREQASRLCRLITSAGAGKVQRSTPEGDGCRLDFGDGSSLTLWAVDIAEETAAKPTGTFIRYVGADGAVYQYDTDGLQFHEAAEILALP
ncbi:hypothetical protein [Gemmiger sp.]